MSKNNLDEIELEKIMNDVVSESRPEEITIDASVASPNTMDRDGGKISSIVIHATSTFRIKDVLRLMTDPTSNVSTHYLVGRDGQIKQLVAEDKASLHFGNLTGLLDDVSKSSIGIHVVGNNFEFTNDQYRSCAWLCSKIIAEHGVDLMDIVDTSHVVSSHNLISKLEWPLPRRTGMDWKKLHNLCSMNLSEKEIHASIDDGESDDESDASVDIYAPQSAYMMALAQNKKPSIWKRILIELGLN